MRWYPDRYGAALRKSSECYFHYFIFALRKLHRSLKLCVISPAFYFRRSLYPFGVKAMLVEPGAHKTSIGLRPRVKSSGSAEENEEYGEEYFKGCK